MKILVSLLLEYIMWQRPLIRGRILDTLPNRKKSYLVLKLGAFDAWHITSQIMRHDRNKFKGWLCNMGMDNLFIDEKGNIARGICAGGSQKFVGHLNNLSKVKWPVTPTICPYTYCYCEGEVGITKRKLKPAEIKLLRDKIKNRNINVRV
jgi:hypothetical protein